MKDVLARQLLAYHRRRRQSATATLADVVSAASETLPARLRAAVRSMATALGHANSIARGAAFKRTVEHGLGVRVWYRLVKIVVVNDGA